MGHLDIWVDVKKAKEMKKSHKSSSKKKKMKKPRTVSWFGYYYF